MTPEQLARRRATREAWRARNPREWVERRALKRAAGRLPDAAGPSGSPAALLAEADVLLARYAEIKNGLLAFQNGVPDGPAVRQRSGSPAAVRQHVDGPPLARDVQSSPPPEYVLSPAVDTTTTTRPGGVGGVAVPDAEPDVFRDGELVAAIAARGMDVAILRRRVDDWLHEDPRRRLNVRTVLSFVERWRPNIDAAPGRRARSVAPVTVATAERLAGIEARQREYLAGRRASLVPSGVS